MSMYCMPLFPPRSDAHDYAPVAFHSRPALDTAAGNLDNVVVISGREKGGWSYLTYRRPIAASDSADVAISMSAATSVVCAFASAGSDTLGFHGSNRFTGMKWRSCRIILIYFCFTNRCSIHTVCFHFICKIDFMRKSHDQSCHAHTCCFCRFLVCL